MDHDPLSNVRLPEWWIRLAWLCRGLMCGFVLGLLFAYLTPWEFDLRVVLPAIIATLFLLALTFLPKAYVEQRHRWRAARERRVN